MKPIFAAASRTLPALALLLAVPATPGPAQESFADFQRRQREGANGGLTVSVTTKSRAEEREAENGKVSIGDAKPKLAGVAGSRALSVATLRERARARVGPALKEMMVPEDYDAAIRQAENDVLYEWAENSILAQEALQRSYRVARGEIDARLEEIAEAAGRPGEIEAVLEGFGLQLEDYRVELRDAALAEKLVMDRIDQVYTDDDLMAVYRQNLASFHHPPRVRARAIIQDLSRARDEKDFNAFFDRMDAAKSALRRGMSFEEAAKRYSGAPISRQRGGALGWITPTNRLPEPFNAKIFDYVVGQPTGVLRSDDGRFLYIFEVLEKRPAETVPFAQARRETKLLVYDDVKKLVYEETRRSYVLFLNPSGIPEKYFDRFDVDSLQIL